MKVKKTSGLTRHSMVRSHIIEGVVASAVYTSVCTLIIGFMINKTMGLKVSESEENIGLDQIQHGEVAYNI